MNINKHTGNINYILHDILGPKFTKDFTQSNIKLKVYGFKPFNVQENYCFHRCNSNFQWCYAMKTCSIYLLLIFIHKDNHIGLAYCISSCVVFNVTVFVKSQVYGRITCPTIKISLFNFLQSMMCTHSLASFFPKAIIL